MQAERGEMFPSMPEIGKGDTYYTRGIAESDERGDAYARCAYKVGQYITLALSPKMPWPEKLRYFKHALKRHCSPPPTPDEDVWAFYQNLTNLVRYYCGQEALRICSAQDDLWAARVAMGQPKEEIENEAEMFFNQFIDTDKCPGWFTESDWNQLKIIRDQWI